MTQSKDQIERRCPLLGGMIPFQYCKTAGEGNLPCRKTIDCWWEYFNVEAYLDDYLDEDELEAFYKTTGPPKAKMNSLLELIQQAKERSKPADD